jgi:hypothetical protein
VSCAAGCQVLTVNLVGRRSEEVFAGMNVLNFGAGRDNWIQLPIV